jgi:hypothetical protein
MKLPKQTQRLFGKTICITGAKIRGKELFALTFHDYTGEGAARTLSQTWVIENLTPENLVKVREQIDRLLPKPDDCDESV